MPQTLDEIAEQLSAVVPTALGGSIVDTVGTTAAVADFPAPVGAVVEVERQTGGPITAEVIGFRENRTVVSLMSDVAGVRRGNRVRLVKTSRFVRADNALLGRVINARGQCIDGGPQPPLAHRVALDRKATPAMERPPIDTPLSTGIRAIDGLLTCGRGQRVGIFAGSGVGKSVTLGMMARYTQADVNVVALIGERGREVNDFLKRDLGPGLKNSVVIVATSDEPALVRVQAAHTATAIAEFFRDQGKDVLLVMDSLTRWALAQREIGLAAGEPPTTRGFPPSVFGMLPKLLERAGRCARGSITGFYSVLVEGDDPHEPICDTTRGLLDGHVWLSRKLAARGHYPAIDVSQSVSRLMIDVVDQRHRAAAQLARELLAVYQQHDDLISIGAYRRGSNPLVDLAIDMREPLDAFLRQRVDEPSSIAAATDALVALAQQAEQHRTTDGNSK